MFTVCASSMLLESSAAEEELSVTQRSELMCLARIYLKTFSTYNLGLIFILEVGKVKGAAKYTSSAIQRARRQT